MDQKKGVSFIRQAFFHLCWLLSKPMAVTLPVVLLIFDYYPYERVSKKKSDIFPLLYEKIPFLVLTSIVCVITIWAQGKIGAIKGFDDFTPALRIYTGINSLGLYLSKMLFSVNLAPFYPYPKEMFFFSFQFLLAIVLVFFGTFFCFMNKNKALLSVIGFYVILLLPVLGILQVGSQSAADRYTYLTSIAPFLTGSTFIVNLIRWSKKNIFNNYLCFIYSGFFFNKNSKTNFSVE